MYVLPLYLMGSRLKVRYEDNSSGNSWKGKGVMLVDKDGNCLRSFASASDAGRILGVNNNEVGVIANGMQLSLILSQVRE